MSNTWFRMYTDFLNDPKMISLAFEDQRHFIGVLALKSDGTVDQDCDIKLLDRIVSQRLWIEFSIINDVKKRLVDAGLINDKWQPLAWDKRQYHSDSSTERTRKYREKQKNKFSDNEETSQVINIETSQKRHSDALDTDTDTDTELNTIDTNVSIVGNDRPVLDHIPDCPHQEIISLFAKHLPMGIQPKEWDGSRASLLKTRWREKKKRQDLAWWNRFFEYIAESDFLTGKVSSKDRKPFEITLPWVLKAENFNKIVDGVYHRS